MNILGLVILSVPLILWAIWSHDQEQKHKQEREAAQRQEYLLKLESSPLYQMYLVGALAGCVNSNHHACELARPVDVTNHLAQPGQGVIWSKKYNTILFCYRFERSVVCPGGKLEYSTFPARQMTDILNRALPNYCLRKGVQPLKIVDQKDSDAGFVYFYISPFKNWDEVTGYLCSVGVI